MTDKEFVLARYPQAHAIFYTAATVHIASPRVHNWNKFDEIIGSSRSESEAWASAAARIRKQEAKP